MATIERVPSIGPEGPAPRQLAAPRALTVSARDELVIADTGNARVQIFTLPDLALRLKTLEARSKTTGQDIVYQQAVKNMIQFAETLNDSGVGGCFAIVEINGNTIITDDEPFVVWNQGRGGLHTEHRLLPLLLDNLRDYGWRTL